MRAVVPLDWADSLYCSRTLRASSLPSPVLVCTLEAGVCKVLVRTQDPVHRHCHSLDPWIMASSPKLSFASQGWTSFASFSKVAKPHSHSQIAWESIRKARRCQDLGLSIDGNMNAGDDTHQTVPHNKSAEPIPDRNSTVRFGS